MIRGYTAIVGRDSPLPNVTPGCCRKATIKLFGDHLEFYIAIEATDYQFKMVGNIRKVDKISSGLVRIGFIEPQQDIAIWCNPRELETFVDVVHVVSELTQRCTHIPVHRLKNRDSSSVIRVLKATLYWFVSPSSEAKCLTCLRKSPSLYIKDPADPNRIVSVADHQLRIHRGLTVVSYTYLKKIVAVRKGMVEISEAVGTLPCLSNVNFGYNRLGEGTDWTWLTSPFIKENLHELDLTGNKLSRVPEGIAGLRNLRTLYLGLNDLVELPAAMGRLKNLRHLNICDNQMESFPTWMYRMERFSDIFIGGNKFHLARGTYRSKPRLYPEFFSTVTVPSLLQTIARFIIINRLPFWEYDIPARLAEYLEAAYFCRCGSIVFPDTVDQLIKCRIKLMCLEGYRGGEDNNDGEDDDYDDDDEDDDEDEAFNVPIDIHFCSYMCYKLIERHMKV